jgi:DNA modification methylase
MFILDGENRIPLCGPAPEIPEPPVPHTSGPLINQCLFGDCRASMRDLIEQGVKVQTVVTSPPYFGLRDYQVDGQIGLEQTPAEYVANLVEVFRLVRQMLADDGVVFLNLGDSYARTGGTDRSVSQTAKVGSTRNTLVQKSDRKQKAPDGLKEKDLIGIPWRVAFALQADGWYLRQDIIWAKPNPMPESVTDRCTKAHEYIFMLTKNARYYYDNEAIKEPVKHPTMTHKSQKVSGAQVAAFRGNAPTNLGRCGTDPEKGRNRRSVWTVSTKGYSGAHFAVFPPDLIEPCVLAASRPGDTVFDPFLGSGTTAVVARRHNRHWLGCELNPEYGALQQQRLEKMK